MVICPVRGRYNHVQKLDVNTQNNEFSFETISKPTISAIFAIIHCAHLSQNSIIFPGNVECLHGSSDEYNHVLICSELSYRTILFSKEDLPVSFD